MGYYTGTFDFETLNNPEGSAILNWASTSFMGLSVITWALLLIFIGGAGKSAMLPFISGYQTLWKDLRQYLH